MVLNATNAHDPTEDRSFHPDGIARALKTGWSQQESKVVVPVQTPYIESKGQNGRQVKEPGDPAFSLTSTPDGVLVFDDYNGRVTDGVGSVRPTFGNEAPRNGVKILAGMKLHRLTPLECERLQGFPDGWTAGVSDTQRYKMMGNAVTVNVVEAIGRKILETW